MAVIDHIFPDSPTNTFATWNPLFEVGAALSNGNLRISDSSSNSMESRPTSFAFPNKGKWYAEFYLESVNNTDDILIYVRHNEATTFNALAFRTYSGSARISDESQTYTNSATGAVSNGSIIGILVDFDNNKIIYNEDGLYSGEVSITSNDNYNYYFGVGFDNKPGTKTVIANFGQDSTFNAGTSAGTVTDKNGYGLFKYTPINNSLNQITDFKALCTANLPNPAIDPNVNDLPEYYMKSVIWTGQTVGDAMTSWDGTTGTIECGFQPDLVWSKGRGPNTWNNFVHDSVRGGGNYLITNDTGAENTTLPNIVESFNSSGFTIKGNGNSNNANDTYVAWCWKAGGAPSADGVAMVDGSATTTTALKDAASASITPTRMSVNTKAGFSIVKYTGTGSTATIPHGLSAAPDLIITKILTLSAGWACYHSALGASRYIWLDEATTGGSFTNYWGTPNNSTFGGASGGANNNPSSEPVIAYCWHSVAGYSAFGSYTGNGSATDGPFVYTGFRPAFVLLKNYYNLTTGNWIIYDTARNENNLAYKKLAANLSDSENQDNARLGTSTTLGIDILSNGFKILTGGPNHNYDASSNYIYAAWAEQPFKYANAR